MNAKIKYYKNYKVPYIIVVGGQEAEQRTVSINVRGSNKQLRNVPIDTFLDMCDTMNEEHSIDLISEVE
jgi:threonyl-tRNA synthetase